MNISEISGIFCGYIRCVRTNFIIAATNALGIEAASFASGILGTGTGIRNGTETMKRGENRASKDIAESPTACRNAHINS